VGGGRRRLTTVSPLLHASTTYTSFAINESDHDVSALSTINSYARLSCRTETTDHILAGDSITTTTTTCTAYTGYSAPAVIYAGTSIAAILTAIFVYAHIPAGACARAGACTYASPCARTGLSTRTGPSTYTTADVCPSPCESR
jgi:hypothetical protein